MISIIYGIIGVVLDSIGTGFRKKSIDEGNLSKGMFKIFASIFGFFFISFVIFIYGFEFNIFKNKLDLLFLISIVIIKTLNTYLQLHILKNSKLSEILPYDNLDKLFIIIIGFFIFYGTNNGTSLGTLIITIFTLFIILFFTIDIKNIKIPKNIGLFTFHKLLRAGVVLATGYLIAKYSNITYISLNWFFELILLITFALILKDSFKTLFSQSKSFYKNRLLSTSLGRGSWILSLYVIKESGVIIATLLGFIAIIVNIFSMKYILKDNPTKKQITLATIVIFLIGLGYYFN